MNPARSLARRLRAGLLLCAAACAWQAAAQDKPRLRPKPLPEPSDASAAPSNSLSDPTAGDAPGAATRTPGPATAASRTLRSRPPTPPPLVLRSAVHSRYSRPPLIARSTAGQCRAQCAVARTRCAGGEADTSGCDPGWTQCLSTCDGLGYARGP